MPLIGWAGVENGELLKRAQDRFDIFITMDSKMADELNIQNSKLTVIVLKAASNMLSDTFTLMPKVLAQLPTAKAGTIIFISALDRSLGVRDRRYRELEKSIAGRGKGRNLAA